MKIRPVGAELRGQTDGWTDTTKLIVAFRNISNAPKTANSRLYEFKTSNFYNHEFWQAGRSRLWMRAQVKRNASNWSWCVESVRQTTCVPWLWCHLAFMYHHMHVTRSGNRDTY
jgi:hypothetical protein